MYGVPGQSGPYPSRLDQYRLTSIIRLAGLPKEVLDVAQHKADQLKVETGERLTASIARRARKLLAGGDVPSLKLPPAEILRNAQVLAKTLSLVRRA